MKLVFLLVLTLLATGAICYQIPECAYDFDSWCTDSTIALANSTMAQYAIHGYDIGGNFSFLYPLMADAVMIRVTESVFLQGKPLVQYAFVTDNTTPQFRALSVNAEATTWGIVRSPATLSCGAMANYNRTLYRPAPIPGALMDTVQEIGYIYHYWLPTDANCTKVQLAYINEQPNANGLIAFLYPIFTWTVDDICDIISGFCDNLGANPYSVRANSPSGLAKVRCRQYLNTIPENSATPCGPQGMLNLAGNGLNCYRFTAAGMYTWQAENNTQNILNTCVGLGPDDGSYTRMCSKYAMPYMDPQCDTFTPQRMLETIYS
jgi:hypothetical protein